MVICLCLCIYSIKYDYYSLRKLVYMMSVEYYAEVTEILVCRFVSARK